MTVLNDMIRRAKARPTPEFVEIRWNHIGSLVEAVMATKAFDDWSTRAKILGDIIRGEAKVMGVPIRPVGVPPEIRAAQISAIQLTPGPDDLATAKAWHKKNPGLGNGEI